MLTEEVLHRQSVPGGTVVGVVAVVEEELLALNDVAVRQGAGDDAVPGVLTEPLPAVVLEAVVHLVAQGGRVVAELDQVAGQVDPLPTGVVSIDKYLVAGTLPVLLLARLIGKSDLQFRSEL